MNTKYQLLAKLTFSIFALTLLSASPVFAQRSNPTVRPPNDAEKSMVSLLKLEYDMAESQYLIHRTKKNKNRKELLLEKLVSFHCMRELRYTFTYEGPPEDNEKCTMYLDLLEKVSEKENPIAICARNGIHSTVCTSAYDNQYIVSGVSRDDEGGLEKQDLTQKLYSVRTEMKRSELKDQLVKQEEAYKSNPKLETLEELEKTMKEFLQVSCKLTSVDKVTDELQETDKATYNPSTVLSDDPVGRLVDNFQRELLERRGTGNNWTRSPAEANFQARSQRGKLAANEELNRADPFSKKRTVLQEDDKGGDDSNKTYHRVRVLSDDCHDSIDIIERINDRFTFIPCYREGFMSPRCVDNLKLYREKIQRRRDKKARENGGTQQVAQPGLATF